MRFNRSQQDGRADAAQFVEVRCVLLEAGSRAPAVPADTASVPLVMLVRGFLESAALEGDEVAVTTLSGRQVVGVLEDAHPRHVHDFGEIDPDLLAILRSPREEVSVHA